MPMKPQKQMTANDKPPSSPALLIEIQRADNACYIPTDAQLQQWLYAACCPDAAGHEVCLRIVDREEMTELNRRFRHKNQATNVLSFPADIPEELALPLLGDIVICADVLAEQAREQGKTADAHWAHICIHGLLHLQGYDHINDQDAQIMETLETQILADLGYDSPY